MYDVVALGESLIDFAPEGVNAAGVPLYSCNPGGALANLLAMIAKLGGIKWDASVHTTIGLFI